MRPFRGSQRPQAPGVLRYWVRAHGFFGLPRRRPRAPSPRNGLHPLAVCSKQDQKLFPIPTITNASFQFDDMTDEGGLRDSVEGVKMAIDVTMNVLHNPDAPAPKFKIAASLHRLVLIQCVSWMAVLNCSP